jgi:hypothetical protein
VAEAEAVTGPGPGSPWLDPDVWADPPGVPEPLEPPADPDPDGLVLQFSDVGEFVEQLLRPVYRRRLGADRLWCAHWFLHAEAVARLEGVWRAYERLRVEDEWTGISTWQRDFLDYHLGVLMDSAGPFQLCLDGHVDLPPLPGVPPPAGMF